ncbi:hypothetical protein [Brevibacillus antibioticus]|uniref:hypothetical protein n=1 Tax=Brevibacillus antibioticus TaxID=2570228 RepID=UPI00138FEF28|nr:hypothetical protein [Brevibacillus antibioticus]
MRGDSGTSEKAAAAAFGWVGNSCVFTLNWPDLHDHDLIIALPYKRMHPIIIRRATAQK